MLFLYYSINYRHFYKKIYRNMRKKINIFNMGELRKEKWIIIKKKKNSFV